MLHLLKRILLKFIINRKTLSVSHNSKKYSFTKFDGQNWTLVAMSSLGIYEADTFKIISNYLDTNKVSVDIGANVGIFSVFLDSVYSKNMNSSFKEKKIISFDPNPSNVNYLNSLVNTNKLSSIKVESFAVGNSSEIIPLYIESDNPSAWGTSQTPSSKELLKKIEVKQTSLDTYFKNFNFQIGFIKIDVEGFEIEVIEGALKTIKKHKPIICFELNLTILAKREKSVNILLDNLYNNNYELFFENSKGKLQPFTWMNERIMNIHAFPNKI